MQLEKYINKLKAIDQKIRLKATGTPEHFAESLDMSKRSLYRYIDYLKDIGAPIAYDIVNRTFFYKEPIALNLQIKINPLNDNTINKTYGGFVFDTNFKPKEIINFY